MLIRIGHDVKRDHMIIVVVNKPLRLLDLRHDAEMYDKEKHGFEKALLYYEPAKRRWKKSGDNMLVTSAKVECIRSLQTIVDMHQNVRLSVLLSTFRDLYDRHLLTADTRLSTTDMPNEQKSLTEQIENILDHDNEPCLDRTLSDRFERLFVNQQNNQYSLQMLSEVLSGAAEAMVDDAVTSVEHLTGKIPIVSKARPSSKEEVSESAATSRSRALAQGHETEMNRTSSVNSDPSEPGQKQRHHHHSPQDQVLTAFLEGAGEELDWILIDILMYEDNRLFDAAFALLRRKYSEREHLIRSLQQVVLLPQMSLPLFGNVGDLQTRLGFLRFLVRSTEVWAVKSELAGDFIDEHCQVAADTLRSKPLCPHLCTRQYNQPVWSPGLMCRRCIG